MTNEISAEDAIKFLEAAKHEAKAQMTALEADSPEGRFVFDCFDKAIAALRSPGASEMREALYCTLCGRETPHAPVPDPNPPTSTATSIPDCEAPARPHCELCGELMPPGEEMFKYHGASGPCPIVPLPAPEVPDTKIHAADEWREEDGDVLWWSFPIVEPPHLGSPLEFEWQDGYHTHWTRIAVPEESTWPK